MHGKVNIAGFDIGVDAPHLGEIAHLFKDYPPTDGPEAFSVDSGDWYDKITEATENSPSETEFFALSVGIGEKLPLFGGLQTHGVAISYGGLSYIFTAPSGTGKSTRAFLWQKYLGEDKVGIINGDKPILRFTPDKVLACGSPWCGKEGLHRNECLPLGGICLLRRSPENRIRKASPEEFFDFCLKQVQMPSRPDSLQKALGLTEELYYKVPIFVLENDITAEGVKVCYEALTGMDFEKNRKK